MIKKRRDQCIVLLDDCFDCISAAKKLADAGFEVCRFTTFFPDVERKREQSVKDGRVIGLCHEHGFLLFTTDKEMRTVHAVELLKTGIGVVATSSNDDEDAVNLWTGLFISAKAKILRDHKKHERPYFCVLHRSGQIVHHEIKPKAQRPNNRQPTTRS